MPFQGLDIDWEGDLIIPALRQFYASPDGVLVDRSLNERNLVAHIYFYMRGAFVGLEPSDPDLSIDYEYNRNYNRPKYCYPKCAVCTDQDCAARRRRNTTLIPDIIIHHRGFNDNNQVVMEFKTRIHANDPERWNDAAKLSYLTCQCGDLNDQYDYKYRVGYFIALKVGYFIITKYENHMKGDAQTIHCPIV